MSDEQNQAADKAVEQDAAPADEWKTWATWGDVPEETKAHLIEGPFNKGIELDSWTPFYEALKKIVAALALMLAFGLSAHAQNTTTLTAHLADPSGTAVNSKTYLQIELKGAGGNQCKVAGVGVITPYVLTPKPDASGNISQTLYKTSAIVCGTSTGNSSYMITVWRDGKPQAPCALQINSATTLESASCLNATATPVTALPTSSVFAQIDGSNVNWGGDMTFNGHNLSSIGALTAQSVQGIVSPTAFTDAAIVAAIAAAPDGGEVYLPAGTYTLSGSLPITISKRITIRGAGRNTVLQVGAGVGATTDVFLIKPSASFTGGTMDGVTLSGFYITPASGTPGRSGIMIDGTNAPTANLVIERIRIDTLGSYALNIQNAGTANGPYNFSLRDCQLVGGMNLDGLGDSALITNNVFSGVRDIVINQEAPAGTDGGAHGFQFIGNNVTVDGGSIIKNAWQGVWAFNDMEQPNASTEANSALLDIQGNASGSMKNFKVHGNLLGATTGNVTDTIRVDRATATEISNNYTVRATGKAYRITANAVNTHIVHDKLAPDTTISNFLADLGANTLVEYVDSATTIKTIANGFGLQLATTAGVVGTLIAPASFQANATNGVFGFTSGAPGATSVDTAVWRGGANQWVFGNAFGDTSGNLLYKSHAFVEGAATSAVSGRDVCYGDSTAHVVKCSYNNGTFFQIPQVITATSAGFATATTAGTCVQNTTAVTGATTAMAVTVSPVSTPGVGAVWSAFVSSAGNVTINECAVAASAGGTIAFNIRVTP